MPRSLGDLEFEPQFEARVRPDVYHADGHGGIEFRMGSIRIEDEVFVNESDIVDRPLHANGLNLEDLAVFIDFFDGSFEPGKEPSHEIGYLVTHVRMDRSGVLVPGDLIVTSPEDYLDKDLERRLSMVEPDAFAEFNLESLGALLIARRKS